LIIVRVLSLVVATILVVILLLVVVVLLVVPIVLLLVVVVLLLLGIIVVVVIATSCLGLTIVIVVLILLRVVRVSDTRRIVLPLVFLPLGHFLLDLNLRSRGSGIVLVEVGLIGNTFSFLSLNSADNLVELSIFTWRFTYFRHLLLLWLGVRIRLLDRILNEVIPVSVHVRQVGIRVSTVDLLHSFEVWVVDGVLFLLDFSSLHLSTDSCSRLLRLLITIDRSMNEQLGWVNSTDALEMTECFTIKDVVDLEVLGQDRIHHLMLVGHKLLQGLVALLVLVHEIRAEEVDIFLSTIDSKLKIL